LKRIIKYDWLNSYGLRLTTPIVDRDLLETGHLRPPTDWCMMSALLMATSIRNAAQPNVNGYKGEFLPNYCLKKALIFA